MKDQETTALASEQRLLQRLIIAPEGVRPALAEEGDRSGRRLAAVIRDDAPLSAVERLEVYANAYFFRILEVLRKDYPALEASLGEARFHNLVTDYLAAHPPTRFSLRYAGEGLGCFLAGHAVARALREEFPWAADLAALEWAIVDAFDAADHPPLAREDLARVPPDLWAALRLRLDPSVRVIRAAWPVQLLREASDGSQPLPALTAGVTALLVWRKDERVFHRAIDPLEAGLLDLLAGGATFGDLCERMALEIGDRDTPARAHALLERWLERGMLAGADKT